MQPILTDPFSAIVLDEDVLYYNQLQQKRMYNNV